LVIEGKSYDDALAASQAWAQQSGAMPVHAFDQVETLLGQGTLGMELDQQAPHIDTLLVSVGGGGLIGGIAAWYERRVKIIGVEPYGLASDSLAPRRVGELVFPVVKKGVHSVVLVDDDAIRQAQQRLWQDLRIVAEPGGAAAFSALLSGAYKPAMRERVGVSISGGNTTAVAFDG
jgi:threonine dehydratase